MAIKENDKLTKSKTSEEKELNVETIKAQKEELVKQYNDYQAKKEALLGDLQKIESGLAQLRGSLNTLQGLQNEYFAEDVLSDNGAA